MKKGSSVIIAIILFGLAAIFFIFLADYYTHTIENNLAQNSLDYSGLPQREFIYNSKLGNNQLRTNLNSKVSDNDINSLVIYDPGIVDNEEQVYLKKLFLFKLKSYLDYEIYSNGCEIADKFCRISKEQVFVNYEYSLNLIGEPISKSCLEYFKNNPNDRKICWFHDENSYNNLQLLKQPITSITKNNREYNKIFIVTNKENIQIDELGLLPVNYKIYLIYFSEKCAKEIFIASRFVKLCVDKREIELDNIYKFLFSDLRKKVLLQ